MLNLINLEFYYHFHVWLLKSDQQGYN